MKKHVIWSDIDLDLDDWREYLEESYPEFSDDENKLYELMWEFNGDYLEDERVNLNIQLPQEILVIADLGLWYGNRSGYREIKSGNIRDCLYSERSIEYAEWYVDQYGNLRGTGIHHDGTNHYLYRVWKDEVTEAQRDNLKDKIYNGTATSRDLTRHTRSIGKEIAKVYGW